MPISRLIQCTLACMHDSTHPGTTPLTSDTLSAASGGIRGQHSSEHTWFGGSGLYIVDAFELKS